MLPPTPPPPPPRPERPLLIELADGVLGDSDKALLGHNGVIERVLEEKLVSATAVPPPGGAHKQSFFREVSDAQIVLSNTFLKLRAAADGKVVQKLASTLQLAAALSMHAAQNLWKAVLAPHLEGAKKKEGAKMAKEVARLLNETANRFHLAKQGLEKLVDEAKKARERLDTLAAATATKTDALLTSTTKALDGAMSKIEAVRQRLTAGSPAAAVQAAIDDALDAMVADLGLGGVGVGAAAGGDGDGGPAGTLGMFGASVSDECKAFSRSVKAIIKKIKSKPSRKVAAMRAALGQEGGPDGGDAGAAPPNNLDDDNGKPLAIPHTVKLFGLAGVMMLLTRKRQLLGDTFGKGRVLLACR